MPPVIDSGKCTTCGVCVDICTEDVYYGSKKGETPTVTYPDECWHCNSCVEICPIPGAIRLRIPLPMTVVHKPIE